VNSFRELQEIYEDHRGMSFDSSPNKTYTADSSSRNSFRKSLPFNVGGNDNEYAAGQVQFHGPTPISCDEEDNIGGTIDKQTIITFINQLQKQAVDNEMLYAVHMLGLVKELVKSN
jgi:hypothetical protein